MIETWDLDLAYRIAFLLFGGPFALMRLYHERKSRTDNRAENYHEPLAIRLGIVVVQGAGGLGMVLWLVHPFLMQWSEVPLPEFMRWIGAGLGCIGALSTLWVHCFLGENFSPYLHISEEHQLVTTGPYRFARHPMYASLYLLLIGISLLMANWFVFLSQVGVLTVLLIYRLPREEALILEVFGDEYQEYSERVGRFCPFF